MANRNDPASIVAGMGLATSIVTEINRRVINLGGTAQDLHRLSKPEAWSTIEKIAKTIVEDGRWAFPNQMPIHFLEPDVRSYNILMRHGIELIGDLVGKTDTELLQLEGMTPEVVERIVRKLAEHGLELKSLKRDDPDAY